MILAEFMSTEKENCQDPDQQDLLGHNASHEGPGDLIPGQNELELRLYANSDNEHLADPDNTLDLMVRAPQRRSTNIGNLVGKFFSSSRIEPKQTLSANLEVRVPESLELV